MSEPIIVCENLVKIFKVAELEVVALQGLDLTVQRGELLGIVGSSGSGKSTLMNVLGGLVRPSAGQVVVNGHDLLKLSDAAQSKYRREEVGFVWQQAARNLIPYLSAVENVTLPMTLAGRERQARQRAGELLDLVGLAERRDHRLPQLSGGEQQRVAIARALAHDPLLILADEPTGNLDEDTGETVLSLLLELTRDAGKTLFMATHAPEVARLATRVLHLADGEVILGSRYRFIAAHDKPARLEPVEGTGKRHCLDAHALSQDGLAHVARALDMDEVPAATTHEGADHQQYGDQTGGTRRPVTVGAACSATDRVLGRSAHESDNRRRGGHGKTANAGGLGDRAVADVGIGILLREAGKIESLHHTGSVSFTHLTLPTSELV